MLRRRPSSTERVGVGVDLRVANASEYRAWNVGSNGIVQTSGGFFGLINVLAPRDAGTGSDWHGDVTYVDLRFEFVDPINGAPLTLSRTFLSFYDFDHANSDAIPINPRGVECLAVGASSGLTSTVFTAPATEGCELRERQMVRCDGGRANGDDGQWRDTLS